MSMQLIYGTGNPAKIQSMKRNVQGMPLEVIGLKEAAQKAGIVLPDIEENGDTPIENARLKAEVYFKLFRQPVFSCDSGLYLWNHKTGEMLPNEEQPGIHIRGRGEVRLTDDELIERMVSLVRKYGSVRARYQNAICLILDENTVLESEAENLWGEPFLFTDMPHARRQEGFPLDSISVDIKSGRYYYDMEDERQDVVAADQGFKEFFEVVINGSNFG